MEIYNSNVVSILDFNCVELQGLFGQVQHLNQVFNRFLHDCIINFEFLPEKGKKYAVSVS